MLNRLILKSLQEWKSGPVRKPLVLRGARQVGKTVAVRMFGASNDLSADFRGGLLEQLTSQELLALKNEKRDRSPVKPERDFIYNSRRTPA